MKQTTNQLIEKMIDRLIGNEYSCRPVTYICPNFQKGLSEHKSKSATLLRPNWAFSKQILLRLPSARHQITGLVWKSSDGGQQMHRKCFWSNKRAQERGGMEGKKWVWLWVHVRLTTSMCLCFRLCVDERWMLSVWGVFWHHGQVSYERRLMVVLILLSPAPLCLCAPWCHMWQGRRAGGLFVMWYCSLRRHEMRICFFYE